jgi:iron complex transport system substrate-binding protein
MDNELVNQTKAVSENHLVFLTPSVWYLAGGGITATDVMLHDIETGMGS